MWVGEGEGTICQDIYPLGMKTALLYCTYPSLTYMCSAYTYMHCTVPPPGGVAYLDSRYLVILNRGRAAR